MRLSTISVWGPESDLAFKIFIAPVLLAMLFLSGCNPQKSDGCRADSECQKRCEEYGYEAIENALCEQGVCLCFFGADSEQVDIETEPEDSTEDLKDSADDSDSDGEDDDSEPEDLADSAELEDEPDADPEDSDSESEDLTEEEFLFLPCASDMVDMGDFCMDRYEAPNHFNGLPFVMFTFDEAKSWCEARNKRLCYDNEWTTACEGQEGWAFPYGNVRVPGRCNDDKEWRLYTQGLLNLWPSNLVVEDLELLEDFLDRVENSGANPAQAAVHIRELYQGDPSGLNDECVNAHGVYDLIGNVEEWTERSVGGQAPFSGNLKGRYWAESRTCQSNITSHGDGFRFYEIGFRCCSDPEQR